MKKEDGLKVILQSAKSYCSNLENQNVLFVFNNKLKETQQFEVAFFPRNFLHLTGVELAKTIGSSVDFYNLCLKNKLGINDFNIPKDGTSEMKLSILPQLVKIHKTARMIGIYNNFKANLKTEKLTGTVTASLGFVREENYYVPNTALKEDIRNVTNQPQQIIAIFTKEIRQEKYNCLSYLQKSIKPRELKLPEYIFSKIDLDNLNLDFEIKT
jgi:hypothetical protein